MEDISKIIEKIESKKKDSIEFQKKYKIRKMKELEKYYEGAEWAFTFSLALLNEEKD
tara:strand:+ start:8632 stop:8802 length:171 start_codon:yes stop_codon:yes gene_type:complete